MENTTTATPSLEPKPKKTLGLGSTILLLILGGLGYYFIDLYKRAEDAKSAISDSTVVVAPIVDAPATVVVVDSLKKDSVK